MPNVAKRKPCRCHSDESLYGRLNTCPKCGHRSFDGIPGSGEWGGCERRKCGYEELAGIPIPVETQRARQNRIAVQADLFGIGSP